MKKIQSIVLTLEEEITFCHNDLLVHNILFNPVSENVRFIDYEYADYNYSLYDLANHFCEYAGVDNPDFSRCPNQGDIRNFLRIYLEERYGYVDEGRLNQMANRCPLFQAVQDNPLNKRNIPGICQKVIKLAHLLWSAWAVVQARNSTLDFDYISYAKIRYDQYLKLMKNLSIQQITA